MPPLTLSDYLAALAPGHSDDAALALAREALAAHPHAGLLWLRLAELLERAGEPAEAAVARDRAIAISPRLAAPLAPAAPLEAPIASLVIPVFNKLELTQLCLEALVNHTPGELFEVIVVDNASSDGTAEFLACLEGDVQVITNAENLGFARACNQGARAATGQHVIFLNNDTVPQPGWLEAMLAELKQPDVGLVGCKLLYPQDGTIQHAGVHFFSYGVPAHSFMRASADAPEVNRARDVDAVTGACFGLPRSLFWRVGGFDAGYVNGYEDVDLCLRVRREGLRVRYTPHAVLYHFESQTPGRHDREVPNLARYMARWSPHFDATAFQPLGVAEPGAAPGLLWQAPIGDQDAYGQEARDWVTGLQPTWPLTARLVGFPRMQALERLPADTRAVIERAFTTRPTPGFVRVSHLPERFAVDVPDASYQVGRWLGWEGLHGEALRETLAIFDEVWVSSRYAEALLREHGCQARLFCLPESVDTRRYRAGVEPRLIPGARSAVFLAPFVERAREGWAAFLEAWAAAFAPHEEATLVVYLPEGSRQQPADVSRLIEAFLVERFGKHHAVAPITVLDERIAPEAMPALLAAATAFVWPHEGEGPASDLLQAMACERPVLALDWAATAELVSPDNGLPIAIARLDWSEAGPVPVPELSAWKDALRRIASEPGLAAALGARARADVIARHDLPIVLALVEERLAAIGVQPSPPAPPQAPEAPRGGLVAPASTSPI